MLVSDSDSAATDVSSAADPLSDPVGMGDSEGAEDCVVAEDSDSEGWLSKLLSCASVSVVAFGESSPVDAVPCTSVAGSSPSSSCVGRFSSAMEPLSMGVSPSAALSAAAVRAGTSLPLKLSAPAKPLVSAVNPVSTAARRMPDTAHKRFFVFLFIIHLLLLSSTAGG